MKTINSKKSNSEKIETFYDQETKEYIGFSGTVRLYNEDIFIDTRTGLGYSAVIQKLQPLIHKFMLQFRFNGNSTNDTRHDIIVHILEGIPKYNPEKNTKLSTFIEMRVNRRLINELRDRSRMSKNATYLNVGKFHVVCSCGNNFVTTINISDFSVITCGECGKLISCAKKIPVCISEVNESTIHSDDMRQTNIQIEDHEQIMYERPRPIDEEVIFKHDMQTFLETADPRLIKIVELIYFKDYSIKAAAEQVGLTWAGTNMKLKDLQDNKTIQELFNRL